MMGRTSVDPEWKSIREDGSDYPGNEHPSMMALQTGKPVTGAIMGKIQRRAKGRLLVAVVDNDDEVIHVASLATTTGCTH